MLCNHGLEKNLSSSSSILLAWGSFLLVLVNDLVGGWLTWSLADWAASKLQKLLAQQATCPRQLDRTFAVTSLHLFVYFTFDCFNSIEMMDMESMKKKMDSSDLAMIAGE